MAEPVSLENEPLSEYELVELLRVFYSRLFPFTEFEHWLSHSSKANDENKYAASVFERREFSFTLTGDIYMRFLSFPSASEFKELVLRRVPVKIDLGAVYTAPPSDRKKFAGGASISSNASEGAIPLEKEFVLDIDLSDYDDVRTCCSGAALCAKCWVFLAAAIRVLHETLRHDFGFKSLLWIFSGRRGVHCWVCDSSARALSNAERTSIIKYLNLARQHNQNFASLAKQQHYNAGTQLTHPMVERAANVLCAEYFEPRIVPQQKITHCDPARTCIMKALPFDFPRGKSYKLLFEAATNAVHGGGKEEEEEEEQEENAVESWNNFKNSVQGSSEALCPVIREVVLMCAYPRLDDKVSTAINHLLKAPFCVHPKTGKVCVPIDPMKADSFDPSKVPTITTLVAEVNQEAGAEFDIRNSSLYPYLRTFQRFVNSLNIASDAQSNSSSNSQDSF